MNDNNFIEQINLIISNLQSRFIPDKNLMTAIAGHMLASVENNFATQGSLVLGGWPQLKPATLKAKSRKGLSSNILEATGQLQRSLQANANETESVVSTNLIYARSHQFGADIFHHPRTRELAFRMKKKFKNNGKQWDYENLMRQETNPNLMRFAGKRHKNALRYTISQQSYMVNIPARPFMVLTDSYKSLIIKEIQNHIAK